MSDLYQKLETCLASVRKRTDFKPEVALILGSGLGDYADEIQIETTIDYTEIEGFQPPQLQATKADLYLDM